MAEKHSVKINIFGKNYVISTDESEEQIHKASRLVDSMMKDAAEKLPQASQEMVAVLISLQLATDLTKAKRLLEGAQSHAGGLVSLIEKELQE